MQMVSQISKFQLKLCLPVFANNEKFNSVQLFTHCKVHLYT